ncbi:hypothetical protein [Streptomyces sp. NPDC048650]|uniref:hypothetical protein n=1 Tax=unclassified Streptomyces TaxID=2593676 RepID=UPI003722D667
MPGTTSPPPAAVERRRPSLFLIFTLLAALTAALFSPSTALAADPVPAASPYVARSATCTSPDPVVCRIREMTPQERAAAREVRIRYHHLLDRMREVEQEMRAEGRSDEEIARVLVTMRNDAKDITRAGMSPEAVQVLEERNTIKYGNPLGPTADQLYAKYGNWPDVIAATTRTSPAVDRELGLEPHQ